MKKTAAFRAQFLPLALTALCLTACGKTVTRESFATSLSAQPDPVFGGGTPTPEENSTPDDSNSPVRANVIDCDTPAEQHARRQIRQELGNPNSRLSNQKASLVREGATPLDRVETFEIERGCTIVDAPAPSLRPRPLVRSTTTIDLTRTNSGKQNQISTQSMGDLSTLSVSTQSSVSQQSQYRPEPLPPIVIEEPVIQPAPPVVNPEPAPIASSGLRSACGKRYITVHNFKNGTAIGAIMLVEDGLENTFTQSVFSIEEITTRYPEITRGMQCFSRSKLSGEN
jgi:hypothetical protein